jgi:hypothetical protein
MRCYGAMVLGLMGFLVICSEDALAYSCVSAQVTASIDLGRIKKSIDPNSKLPESSHNLAAVGAMYQYMMNKGDTDAAACAAFQMIQYYRTASQTYAVIAAASAQKGGLDTNTRAAMKEYANVPDGQNFQLQKTPDGQVSYTTTDEKTGKVTSHGLETPDNLAASAMGFAKNGFDKALLATAEPEITRRSVQGSIAGKPKATLSMPADPLLDMPATHSQQPMNCVTIELGGGLSSTNCN